MDTARSIPDLFEQYVRIAVVEGDYLSNRSLAILRRCSKNLKALIDHKLTSIKVRQTDIPVFLCCGSTQTVENLSTDFPEKESLWADSNVISKFLISPLPKLQHLEVSWHAPDFEDGSIIGWTGLTSLNIGVHQGEVLPHWISQLENLKVLNWRSSVPYSKARNLELPRWIANLKDLKELDLIDLPLSALPQSLGCLSNLTKLSIKNGPFLIKLPPSMFTQLSNLQSLHLKGLDIAQIPEGITNLKALTSLKLDECSELQSLPDLRLLPRLQVLNVMHNPGIGELPEWVGILVNLQEFSIEYCNPEVGEDNDNEVFTYTNIPVFLSNLQNLTSLRLSNCIRRPGTVWEVPNWIFNFKDLQSLELRDCENLHHIQDSIGELTNLTRLWLECVQIEELPWEIGNLQSLRILALRNCGSLDRIPQSVGQLKSLKELDLHGCSALETLPGSIGDLVALTSFKFRYCGSLIVLPDSISKLTGIETLRIEQCASLLSLPEGLGYMNLSKLHISDLDCLMALPSSIGNLKLETLEVISCNNLGTLPDSLSSLTTMEELALACWRAKELPLNIGNLTQLRSLRIEACYNLNGPPASITSLKALRHLELGFLSSFPDEDIFLKFRFLTTLYLRMGPEMPKAPESLWSLVALQELTIYGFEFKYFPDSFGELIALRNLRLLICRSLVELPKSIGNLTALEEVTLSNCDSLISLPDEFCALKSLERLKIESCYSLLSLPADFGNLSSLRVLRLRSLEALSSLPESIGQLSLLEELELDRASKLQFLPNSISHCTSLRAIILVDCDSLEALPADMSPLQKLRNLQLIGCSSALTTLPKSLNELPNLEVVRDDYDDYDADTSDDDSDDDNDSDTSDDDNAIDDGDDLSV